MTVPLSTLRPGDRFRDGTETAWIVCAKQRSVRWVTVVPGPEPEQARHFMPASRMVEVVTDER